MKTVNVTILFIAGVLFCVGSFYGYKRLYPQKFITSHKLSVVIGQIDGMYNVVVCKKDVDCDPAIQQAYKEFLHLASESNNQTSHISAISEETKKTLRKLTTNGQFIVPQRSNKYAKDILVIGNQSNLEDFPSDIRGIYRINVIFGSIDRYIFYTSRDNNSWGYNLEKTSKIIEIITNQIVTGRDRLENCEICKSA